MHHYVHESTISWGMNWHTAREPLTVRLLRAWIMCMTSSAGCKVSAEKKTTLRFVFRKAPSEICLAGSQRLRWRTQVKYSLKIVFRTDMTDL